MKINHQEPAYTDEAAPFIEEFGGKLGGLEFLRTTVPGLRDKIARTVFFKSGEAAGLSQLLPEQQRNPKSQIIVRGSHKNDFQGLVDVLRTEVVQAYQVEESVATVQASGNFPEVVAFAKHENPDYDGKLIIGVQNYHGEEWENYSITDHPNRPSHFLIGSRLCDENSHDSESLYSRKLIQIHKEIGKSGLVKDDYAFQVEISELNGEVRINQVRAFMKKEIGDAFEIPEGRPTFVFGVTPPEGIETDLYCSPDGLDKTGAMFPENEAWSLLKTHHANPPPLNFLPGENFKAYLISQAFYSGVSPVLEHNHFRLAQKADVTIFENVYGRKWDYHWMNALISESGVDVNRIYRQLSSMTDPDPELLREFAGKLKMRVRITSNGTTIKVEAL